MRRVACPPGRGTAEPDGTGSRQPRRRAPARRSRVASTGGCSPWRSGRPGGPLGARGPLSTPKRDSNIATTAASASPRSSDRPSRTRVVCIRSRAVASSEQEMTVGTRDRAAGVTSRSAGCQRIGIHVEDAVCVALSDGRLTGVNGLRWEEERAARRRDVSFSLKLERRCASVDVGHRQGIVDMRNGAMLHEGRVQRLDAGQGGRTEEPSTLDAGQGARTEEPITLHGQWCGRHPFSPDAASSSKTNVTGLRYLGTHGSHTASWAPVGDVEHARVAPSGYDGVQLGPLRRPRPA